MTFGCNLQIKGIAFKLIESLENTLIKNPNPFDSLEMPTSRRWNCEIKSIKKLYLFPHRILHCVVITRISCDLVPLNSSSYIVLNLSMSSWSTRLDLFHFFSLHLQFQIWLLPAWTLILLFIFSNTHLPRYQ